MALPKLFQRIFWHNSTTPAINEDNLNAMSKGLSDVDDRLIGLAGTIMEDVPQIQEDIEELEEDMALIDTKIASATAEANRATTKANEAAASVISAGNKALISEGYAKGTQNGTPVGSSSPYYRNNAEYFKEQARSFTPTGYQDLVDDVAEAQEAITDIEGEKVSDNEAYVLRQGKGNMVDMSLVGGSIAWNQNVVLPNSTNTSDSHVTITKSSSGTVRVQSDGQNAANDAITLAYDSSFQNYAIAGHVILAIPNATGTSNGLRQKCYVSPDGQWGNVQNLFGSILNTDVISIKKAPSGYGYVNWYLSLSANTTCDITFKPQFFDLTKKLGPTIANYILSLEQATAGAGVAWFRKYFPNVYYGYQSGKIESVNVASRKVVGKNLVDLSKLTDNTYLDGNGDPTSSAEAYLTDYIPIFKGQPIYIPATGTARRCTYDCGKNFVQYLNISSAQVLTPTFDGYIRVSVRYDTLSKDALMIHYGSSAIPYEPYKEYVYPFDTSVQLRGIFKLDENHKLYADGDIYTADGSITRRYTTVTKSSNTSFNYVDTVNGYGRFSIDLPSGGLIKTDNTMSNFLPVDLTANVWATPSYDCLVAGLSLTAPNRIGLLLKGVTSLTDLNTYLSSNPLTIVYPLATPTTETAQPFQNPQRAFINGIEEFVDAGVTASTRDVSIPVGNESEYNTSVVVPISQDYTDGAMEILKEIVASSSDFADLKTKVAAL